MALDRLTKIDGGGISTTSDYRVGVITASKFVGPIEGDLTGSITATVGTFSGNVSIAGTLTYEDVTNIDSVGIITARDGIHVGAGVSAVGVGTFGSLDIGGDIDVDGHTNLDNVSIAGVTSTTGVFVINSGTQSTNTTSGALRVAGGAGIQGNVNVGGDLDVDGHTNLDNVSVAGVTTMSGNLTISNTDPQLAIHDTNHNPSHYYLKGVGGAFKITDSTNGDRLSFNANGSISVTASLFNIVGGSQVSSNLGVTGNLILTDNIIHDGDTDTKIRFPANDQIQFEAGGNEKLKLDSSGNVYFAGNRSGNDRGIIYNDSNGFGIYGSSSGSNNRNIIFFSSSSGTSERLRITSGGKIGIGTDNPTYKLHVDSGDAAIGLWKSRRSSGSYIEYAVGADGAALGYIGAGGQIISSAGADSGDFAIRSQGDLLFSSGGSVERLRITSDGDVLFSGLTSKNDPRNVKGISLKSTSGISFQNYGSNGSHNWRIRPDDLIDWGTLEFSVSPTANSVTDWPDAATDVALTLQPNKDVIVNNGSLGIGINNPSQPLTILRSSAGQGEFGVRFQFTDTNGPTQTTSALLVGTYGLKLKNYNSTRDFIFETGKVGINTDSPSNPLHISDVTSTSAGGLLRLDVTTGDNFILYDNTHDNTEWAVGTDSASRGNFDFWYDGGSGYPANPIVRFNTTGITVQGSTIAADNTLSAVSSTLKSGVTYVDVFVYDTRKDSDGGAWRHRTNNTSWYNETLNTSDRGARKEFPQVAVIGVGQSFIHIFDADDPDMPMWMQFNHPSGGVRNVMYGTGNPRCVYMLNGILCTGSQAANYWPVLIDFIRDDILGLRSATGHNHYNGRQGNISLRNSATSDNGIWWPDTITGGASQNVRVAKRWWFDGTIRDKFVTSVVMSVRPEAPIDKTTGMQIPTIYLGTRSGVSIIHSNVGDTGTSYSSGVYDITSNNGPYSAIGDITITEDGYLWGLCDSYNSFATYRDSISIDLKRLDNQMNDIVTRPDTDSIVSGLNNQSGSGVEKGREYYWVSTGAEGGTHKIGYSNTWAANILERDAWGCPTGLAFVKRSIYTYDHKENGNFLVRSHQNRGLVAMITKDYNTGWHMTGNVISSCYIAQGLTSSISGADAMLDFGHHLRNLGVTGTLTRAKCATGSDLSCVSGFSSSNHARAINLSINAGNPINITMMGWIKLTDIGGYSYLCSIANGTDAMGIAVHATDSSYGGKAYFYDTQHGVLYGDKGINDGEWHHVCGVFSCSSNRKILYIDGQRQNNITAPSNRDYTDLDTIAVGHWCGGSGIDIDHSCRGSLALVKLGLTDLTDQQIKRIYEDEKKLFQPNAKAFLYGSSNSITAIGYDEKKEIYHVGTSSGRSDFSGLSRINNTTTAVTTAISAYDGLIAEQ